MIKTSLTAFLFAAGKAYAAVPPDNDLNAIVNPEPTITLEDADEEIDLTERGIFLVMLAKLEELLANKNASADKIRIAKKDIYSIVSEPVAGDTPEETKNNTDSWNEWLNNNQPVDDDEFIDFVLSYLEGDEVVIEAFDLSIFPSLNHFMSTHENYNAVRDNVFSMATEANKPSVSSVFTTQDKLIQYDDFRECLQDHWDANLPLVANRLNAYKAILNYEGSELPRKNLDNFYGKECINRAESVFSKKQLKFLVREIEEEFNPLIEEELNNTSKQTPALKF